MNKSNEPSFITPAVGTGHIFFEGERNFAIGFPLTRDVVVTAGHLMADRSASDLEYQPHGHPRVKVLDVRVEPDIDVAVLRLAEPVPPVRGWRPARLKEDWYIRARLGERGDPLSGTVSVVGWLMRLRDGTQDVPVIQLIVNNNAGDYQGYSGSPVTDWAGDVLAVQVEQRARQNISVEPEASSVLYATPIEEVRRVFGLDSQPPAIVRPSALVDNLEPVATNARPTGDEWTRTEEFDHHGLEGVMFDPEGSHLVTWGSGAVRVWPIPTKAGRLSEPEVDCLGRDPVLSGDGRWLAVRRGHHVAMWDLTARGHVFNWTVEGAKADAESWEESFPRTGFAGRQVRSHALSSDGQLLAIATFNGPNQLIRVDDGLVEGLPDGIRQMAFSPDSYRFAYVTTSASGDYSIHLTELRDPTDSHGSGLLAGTKRILVDGLTIGGIHHLSFDSSGRWLISGVRGTTTDDRVRRLAASPQERDALPLDRGFVCTHASRNGMLSDFKALNGRLSNLVVGADRFLAVTTDHDHLVQIWPIGRAGPPVPDLELTTSTMASDPAGRFLALKGDSSTVYLLDLDGAGGATTLPNLGVTVRTVAVNGDGAIATGTALNATVWAPIAQPGFQEGHEEAELGQ